MKPKIPTALFLKCYVGTNINAPENPTSPPLPKPAQKYIFAPNKRIIVNKPIITANIQNIIFDLGGVVMNIDYYGPINAFRELGVENFDQAYSKLQQTTLFDDLETGRITPQQFYDGIRQLWGKKISDEQITNAWNRVLLDLPKERLDLVAKLKRKYRIFLLSNTNIIHLERFNRNLEIEHGLKDLSSYFEAVYFSFQLGLRKPDLEIFKLVIREQSLDPKHTLFIDDSPQHVEGALKAGLQAFHLKQGKTILDLFV